MPILPKIHLVSLQNCSIFEQLQLEESLLRGDSRNFCLVNMGSSKAIVMGISGNAEKLLNLEKVQKDKIPVIRRFSGGGTVIVDERTLFITFIFAKKDLEIPAFPESIHRWATALYQEAWKIPEFHFRENDYVIGNKKCGGNAQYIKKDRWLHHTSFLWDYEEKNMDYLLLPPKRPTYRQDRDHSDFLLRLKGSVQSPTWMIESLKSALVKQFYIEEFDLKTREEIPHRKAVQFVAL